MNAKRFLLGMLLAIGLVQVTGCMSLIGSAVHSKVINSLPTFAETEAAWPAIPEGKGRVVVFWPRLPMGGVELFTSSGMHGMGAMEATFDDAYEIIMADQTFFFIDLSEGKHWLKYGLPKRPMALVDKRRLMELDLISGEIKYIKVNMDLLLYSDAQELSAQEAKDQIIHGSIRNLIKEPIPMNKVPAQTRKSG